MFYQTSITYNEDLFEKETIRPEHYHNGFEIDYFTNADVKMFVKNTLFHIKGGCLMLVDKKCLHRLVYTVGTPYTRYVINVSEDFIAPLFDFHGLKDQLDRIFADDHRKITLSLKRRAKIGESFELLYHIYSKPEKTPMDEAQFKAVLFLLLCSISKMSRDPLEEYQNPAENIVHNIISYIENNFQENISLDDLAEKLHVSKYYICHIFKKWSGFSVTEYIQYCRILYAQKLLLNEPDKSITDICFGSGFSNIQHFYRVFRNLCGMTPLEYRRNVKAGH